MLDAFQIEPFSQENLVSLHAFFEAESGLYSFSLDEFRQATIDDQDFDPDVSLVFRDKISGDIIGAYIAIIRRMPLNFRGREFTYVFTTLNMFAVRHDHRRKGLGSVMLSDLIARLKQKKRKKIRLMASVPNYIWPGLDPRYTAAYFFLKKNGFKREKGERQNLIYLIPETIMKPPLEIAGVTIARATLQEKDDTVAFVEKNHAGAWPKETLLSFKNDPCTTFIAKDASGAVVGFAAHSIGFKGSFGPTGVLPSLRGKGIGGALLKWCAWDLKESGTMEMIIRWVEGSTMKFYAKSIGARIHHVYWKMHKKI